jgi:hypothetical protein
VVPRDGHRTAEGGRPRRQREAEAVIDGDAVSERELERRRYLGLGGSPSRCQDTSRSPPSVLRLARIDPGSAVCFRRARSVVAPLRRADARYRARARRRLTGP